MNLGLRDSMKALATTGSLTYPRRVGSSQRRQIILQAATDPSEPDLVVFGDSYSSTYHSAQCLPREELAEKYPREVYQQERFTDGLVWTDILEQTLKFAKNVNWAVGGAKTSCSEQDASGKATPPSVAKQITLHDFSNQHSLYIIWAGINDGLGNDAAGNQISNIRNLVRLGAKKLVVAGYYSLRRLPNQIAPDSVAENAEVFNQQLQDELKALEQEAHVDVLWLDTYAFFETLVANAASYGFANVDKTYVGDMSGDPNSFVFMDNVHWTSHTHRLFAGFALQAIQNRWGDNQEGFQIRQKMTTPSSGEQSF